MQLQNVTFVNWLRSHRHKESEERWLRELYPWPVLARVECDTQYVGRMQSIIYAGVEYKVTLKSIRWQPQHGTFRYRLLVESEGHDRPELRSIWDKAKAHIERGDYDKAIDIYR